MTLKKYILASLMIVTAAYANAQHDHHAPAKKADAKPAVKKQPATPAEPAKQPAPAKKPAAQPPAKAAAAEKAVADTAKARCTLPIEEIDYTKDPQSQHKHEAVPDSAHAHAPAADSAHAQAHHSMPHAFSRSLPMTRNGSGTSWLPDETPMFGYMMHKRGWNMMVHGGIYPRYTSQDIFGAGARGDSDWGSPNWFMLMANRETGKRGLFNFNLMFSLDPLTEGGDGYPLLFQSGETYQGKPLVDRQHPHDLIDELSVAYTHMINEDVDITAYAGYPGEPALGPPAFMHRVSAENNPDAPLSHHWQDPTHITYGVATLGIRYKMIKIEGSSFTGREPDEYRYDFDKPRFDSYSYRLSVNPSPRLALQISDGFIKSPETLEPEDDLRRTTASIIHTKRIDSQSFSSTAAIWGLNSAHGLRSNSFLVESNWQLSKNAVYGRYEYVQKSAHELVIDDHHGDHAPQLYNVNALTFGANRIIIEKWKTQARLGAQATFYKTDEHLVSLYGEYPISAQVYFRINPGRMM